MRRATLPTLLASLLLTFGTVTAQQLTNGNGAVLEGTSAPVSSAATVTNSSGAVAEVLVLDTSSAELRGVAFLGALDPVYDVAGLLEILAQLLDPVALTIPRTDVTGDGVVDAADAQKRSVLPD